MAKTDKELKTISFYDNSATQWVSAHGGNESESYWTAEMKNFMNFCLPEK